MRILASLCGLIVAAGLPAASAYADSFAAAFGVSDDESVETAYDWCRRGSLEDAKLCALNACEREQNGECDFAVWCEPGKWSGVVALRKGNDVKHVAVCEKASRNSALRALKDQCRAFRKASPGAFKSCKVESIVSPNAETSDTNVVTWKYRGGDIR